MKIHQGYAALNLYFDYKERYALACLIEFLRKYQILCTWADQYNLWDSYQKLVTIKLSNDDLWRENLFDLLKSLGYLCEVEVEVEVEVEEQKYINFLWKDTYVTLHKEIYLKNVDVEMQANYSSLVAANTAETFRALLSSSVTSFLNTPYVEKNDNNLILRREKYLQLIHENPVTVKFFKLVKNNNENDSVESSLPLEEPVINNLLYKSFGCAPS